MSNTVKVILIFVCLVMAACSSLGKKEEKPELVLKPAAFSDLPGWKSDNFEEFMPAFAKSCVRIMKAAPEKAFGPIAEAGRYGDWQVLCQKFVAVDDDDARAFFEDNFKPFAVYANDDPEGLFTGYYEASLRGSRVKQGPYIHPLYARPDDLVMVDLGAFRDELKGQRIAGRVEGGNLRPYETREKIVTGQWPHNDQVLVWVDDAVDAFFVQIQGSGVVQLDDRSVMRIGYAGQNGHPYYAVGRELIRRGALTKETVSMQTIRAWLEANPAQADEIMNTNASYVFFQELSSQGPVGGEGVALMAHRSLAVDRSLLPYGLPLWVDLAKPADGAKDIRRLMIAQDTGGAIRGPVRGDVFWGYGPEAEAMAGVMKSKGRYWALVPKTVSRTSN